MDDAHNILTELVAAKKQLEKWDDYFARTCDWQKLQEAKIRMEKAWQAAEKYIKETSF